MRCPTSILPVSAVMIAGFVLAPVSADAQVQGWGIRRPSFAPVIHRVVAMPQDRQLRQRVQHHGLSLVNVTWEDTGRSHGSSVGPNISDVTLQVREPTGRGVRTHLLPVFRYPNFSDRTADIRCAASRRTQ